MKSADAANAITLVRIKNLDHLLLAPGSVHDARIQCDVTAKIQLIHVRGKSVERDKLASKTKSEFASVTMREKTEVSEISRTTGRDTSLARLGILDGTTQKRRK